MTKYKQLTVIKNGGLFFIYLIINIKEYIERGRDLRQCHQYDLGHISP